MCPRSHSSSEAGRGLKPKPASSLGGLPSLLSLRQPSMPALILQRCWAWNGMWSDQAVSRFHEPRRGEWVLHKGR